MISTLAQVHVEVLGIPLEIFAKNQIEVLLDNKGDILDIDPSFNRYASIANELRLEGNIRGFFDIPPESTLDRLMDKGGSRYAVFNNKKDFKRVEDPQAFYAAMPTATLSVCPVEPDRFYGFIRTMPTVPDLFLERPNGIIYTDENNRLVGFNSTFFTFFKDGFSSPHEMLTRPVTDFLHPSPSEIQAQRLEQILISDFSALALKFDRSFRNISELAGIAFHPNASFETTEKGLLFRNTWHDMVYFTFPEKVDLRDDLGIELEFMTVEGEDPFFMIGWPDKPDTYPDHQGYLAGIWRDKRQYIIKHQGLVMAIGEPPDTGNRKRLLLMKMEKGLFLFEGLIRKLGYYDFYMPPRPGGGLSIGLRPGSSCLINRVRVATRPSLAREENRTTHIIQLNTPAQHFFVLNRFNNISLSNSFPRIKAFILENVTEIEKQVRSQKSEYKQLLKESGLSDGDLIGKSKVMAVIRETATVVASSKMTVLIEGETGTGKEVLAKFIHRSGARQNGAFIKVDCTSLPASLLESELFGHEKGAFTGAAERKEGRFELAHNGTLFIDEVGNLTLEAQAKLLQFMQDKIITRVGGIHTIPLDVRIIVASNIPLSVLVKKGVFRADLYYRMEGVRIQIPPLRERKEDLETLSIHFIRMLRMLHRSPVESLSPEAFEKMYRHDWPGNVRELINALERAVLFSSTKVIPASNLNFEADTAARSGRSRKLRTGYKGDLGALTRLFRENKGSMKKTAIALNVDPRTLYNWLKREGHSIRDLRKS